MSYPCNEWLIIVEGNSDYRLLKYYNINEGCHILPTGSRSIVCKWDNRVIDNVRSNLMNPSFRGIILLIDSDDNYTKAFDSYIRCKDFEYIENQPQITKINDYWHIDSLEGKKQAVQVYGIAMPTAQSGCMETELLAAYGFPIAEQAEYAQFVNIIKQATTHWQIPKDGDNKYWYEKNEKAKLDKFIYAALSEGFTVVDKKPIMPSEPCAITTIKSITNI